MGTRADFGPAFEVWKGANTARRGGVPVPGVHEDRVAGYADNPNAVLHVAHDGGRIIGMGLWMQARADDGAGPPVDGLCHISMIFVEPGRWSEGIGTRVLLGVMAEARSRGFSRAQLWTHADNARAHRLYERHGFIRSGRQKDDDLGDLIVHYTRALTSLEG